MGEHFSVEIDLLLDCSQFHAVFPEAVFSSFLDIGDAVHGLESLSVDFPIVLEGLVAFLLEVLDRVVSQLFVVEFAMGFGPSKFSGIVLCLEVTMALRTTEPKGFAVVSDKHDSVSWVDRAGAKVAPRDSHQQRL